MKKLALTIIISIQSLAFLYAQTYNINTIGGDGTAGYTGDGIAATSAELNYPEGIAVDDSGNVYIGDSENNRIRKINKNGIISTIAGNGTGGHTGDGGQATAAEIDDPTGIAVDGSGNIYFDDASNLAVRKIDKSGVITTIATFGNVGLWGIAVDRFDNVYVCELYPGIVQKITGGVSTVAGNGTIGYKGDGGPATSAELDYPTKIAFDDSNNLYIADYNNQVIRKVSNATGIITTIAGDDTACFGGDGGPATSAKLDQPTGVAVDKLGNIYIADQNNQRMRKVTKATGIITTIAGSGPGCTPNGGFSGDGGPATLAELNHPLADALDDSGNIYIVDYGNLRIRKLTNTCSLVLSVNPSSQAICIGQSTILTATVVSGTNYIWSPASGLSATTGDTVVASPVVATTYTVTGTDSLGCTASNFTEISINSGPSKPIITQNGNILTSSATQGNQWVRNDSTIQGATNQTFTVTVAGWYKVLAENPANGCTTASDSIYLSPSGISQSFNNNQLSIYPNPTSGMVFIKISLSAVEINNWNLQITDVLGRIVYSRLSLKYNNAIDLSSLSSGVYFISVTNKTGRTVVPLVKQN